MFELYNQIESMTEDIISDFLNAWQCRDWNVSCERFANLLIVHITESLTQVVKEITEEDEELE